MKRKTKLFTFEVVCIFWMAMAGSLLHFAFELTEFWKPMAFMAAVNESAWEHVKMYFWPGLVFAVVQYTYTRDIANNYWFGKAVGLATMPLVIFVSYFGYMEYVGIMGGDPSLAIMIGIMLFGIAAGQMVSFTILSMEPLELPTARYAAVTYTVLVMMFSTFTYFPPQTSVFEHFYCYQYTGEYGILADYEPYRVFPSVDEAGMESAGGGMNYCEGKNINMASNELVSEAIIQ
jgi:hypothetical protein